MKQDEPIMQNEALTELLNNSQNAPNFILWLGVSGALLMLFFTYWFNKTNKTVVATSMTLTSVQTKAAVEQYKSQQQDEKLSDLKSKNEQASLELKNAMSNMSKEQLKTYKLLSEIGIKVQANELNIRNLKDENKIFSKQMRDLKN